MKSYDILYILKPNLGEDIYKEVTDQFEKWITKNEGKIILLDKMGIRELPSTFDKYTSGYFVHCQFEGTNKTLDEIKQRMKVNENFVRHLLVDLDSVRLNPEKEAAKAKTKVKKES